MPIRPGSDVGSKYLCLKLLFGINRRLTSLTIPEVGAGAKLTLLTAITAFGDSMCLVFISNLEIFDKTVLPPKKLSEGHDYTATQIGSHAYNLVHLPQEGGIVFKQYCNRPKIKPGYFQLVSCYY
jgi:hypothetical protein